jgi:hypothetical protein
LRWDDFPQMCPECRNNLLDVLICAGCAVRLLHAGKTIQQKALSAWSFFKQKVLLMQ